MSQWNEGAAREAAQATADNSEVDNLVASANGALPAAQVALRQARQASRIAHTEELRVRALRDEVIKEMQAAATSAVAKEVKLLKEKAHAEAKKEAMVRAAALKEQMLDEIPAATKAASAPYVDAQNRAAATSKWYADSGDEAVRQAAAMQLEAQVAANEASQLSAMGDAPAAQKKLLRSRRLIQNAANLNAQASSYYSTAKRIADSLPAYTNEAAAAAYSQEVMLNPDARPPPPPLITIS